MSPSVPVNPEPIDALRQRLPAAMIDVVQLQAAAADPDSAPSKQPANVFDFGDYAGRLWRVIVSVDFDPRWDAPMLHVSVSGSAGRPDIALALTVWAALLGRTPSKRLGTCWTGRACHLFFERPEAD